MSITHPGLTSPDRTTQACRYHDLSGIDRYGSAVVEPALEHMATAAAYGCAAVTRNGRYAADTAVDALARTVAATTIIADDISSYLADVWPLAAPLVIRAQRLLAEALGLIDQGNHRCALTPSMFEDEDGPARHRHADHPVAAPDLITSALIGPAPIA